MTRPCMLSLEKEVELRKLYPHTKTKILSELLGLNYQTIRNYAARLQLRKADSKPRFKAGRKMLGAEVRMPIPDGAIKTMGGHKWQVGNVLMHRAD